MPSLRHVQCRQSDQISPQNQIKNELGENNDNREQMIEHVWLRVKNLLTSSSLTRWRIEENLKFKQQNKEYYKLKRREREEKKL